MARSQYETKVWVRKVYDAMGPGKFLLADLPEELKVHGMTKREHRLGLISRVGYDRKKHTLSIWQVNRSFIRSDTR